MCTNPVTINDEAFLFRTIGYLHYFIKVHFGGRGGRQFILVKLLDHGGSMTQRDLVQRAKISSASLSEVLSKMEADGLITRTVCSSDRRQVEVVLTSHGTLAAQDAKAARVAFTDEALACFTDEEKQQFLEALNTMSQHWHTLEDKEESCHA